MTHDRSRRDGASKSRELQALGTFLLSHTKEAADELPPPDLSFPPEEFFGEAGPGMGGLPIVPSTGFDATWTLEAWASEA